MPTLSSKLARSPRGPDKPSPRALFRLLAVACVPVLHHCATLHSGRTLVLARKNFLAVEATVVSSFCVDLTSRFSSELVNYTACSTRMSSRSRQPSPRETSVLKLLRWLASHNGVTVCDLRITAIRRMVCKSSRSWNRGLTTSTARCTHSQARVTCTCTARTSRVAH